MRAAPNGNLVTAIFRRRMRCKMFDILLAVAATQSEYGARQGGRALPEFSWSDGIRFVAGLMVLVLIYAGLSLAA